MRGSAVYASCRPALLHACPPPFYLPPPRTSPHHLCLHCQGCLPLPPSCDSLLPFSSTSTPSLLCALKLSLLVAHHCLLGVCAAVAVVGRPSVTDKHARRPPLKKAEARSENWPSHRSCFRVLPSWCGGATRRAQHGAARWKHKASSQVRRCVHVSYRQRRSRLPFRYCVSLSGWDGVVVCVHRRRVSRGDASNTDAHRDAPMWSDDSEMHSVAATQLRMFTKPRVVVALSYACACMRANALSHHLPRLTPHLHWCLYAPTSPSLSPC